MGEGEQIKCCNTCGIEKPFSDLVKMVKNNGKIYYRNKCKECRNGELREKRLITHPIQMIPDGMKKCGRCCVIKTYGEFHNSKISKSGYSSGCKKCKKEYSDNNKEMIRKIKRDWYINNRELSIERSCKRNKEKRVERNEYLNRYYKNNKHIYMWRTLIYRTLKGYKKDETTLKLLGYTYDELKTHLESLFTDGMTWDNHGEWHVDHIKPLSKFDEQTPLSVVNGLSNLQPLWATTREINGVVYEGNLNKSNN
jgi:hypothetical protein